MSIYILPLFILVTFLFSIKSKKGTLDDFVVGIKNGIDTILEVLPYLIAMMFATKLFVSSMFLSDFVGIFDFKYDPNIVLHAILRPISSSSSLAVLMETYNQIGVDSDVAIKMSILQGSTDTTIFIITLYFGSVGVVRYRYAIIAGLLVDMFAFVVAYFII